MRLCGYWYSTYAESNADHEYLLPLLFGSVAVRNWKKQKNHKVCFVKKVCTVLWVNSSCAEFNPEHKYGM